MDTLNTIAQSIVGGINEVNSHVGDISQLSTNEKTSLVTAVNEVKEEITAISDPYEINLTNLLSAEDSESISTAIGGIDNLNATVQDNRIIVGTISNGSVSVSIRILGNVTTLYYLLDSVLGLTLNEVVITNTSGTLSKNVTTHSVLTENMVINSLDSDETTLPLSAAQGKALNSKIDNIDVSADITNAINALDSSGQTASTGEVISSVSQENGVISVSKKTLTSDDIPELPQSKITDLSTDLAAKQDTLTPGTGIEITPENQINVTLDTNVFKVVSALPDSPAQGDENKIHLVPAKSTGVNNAYTEYVWINLAWEILGEYTSEVDLTPYLKITDAESTYLKITDAASEYATKTELNIKQNSTDDTLETTSKNIVGAINEVNGKSNVYFIDLVTVINNDASRGEPNQEQLNTALGGWDNFINAIQNHKLIVSVSDTSGTGNYMTNITNVSQCDINNNFVQLEIPLSYGYEYTIFLYKDETDNIIVGVQTSGEALDVSSLFADSPTITSEISQQIAVFGDKALPNGDFPIMWAGSTIGNIKPTWIRTSAGVTNFMCIADNKIWYFEIQGTTVQRASLAIS